MTTKEELLLVERDERGFAVITLNRPKVLNALNFQIVHELATLLQEFDRDDSIKVTILTGSERAFAAGADISELANMTSVDFLQGQGFAAWDDLKRIRKPIIAAISGYAL